VREAFFQIFGRPVVPERGFAGVAQFFCSRTLSRSTCHVRIGLTPDAIGEAPELWETMFELQYPAAGLVRRGLAEPLLGITPRPFRPAVPPYSLPTPCRAQPLADSSPSWAGLRTPVHSLYNRSQAQCVAAGHSCGRCPFVRLLIDRAPALLERFSHLELALCGRCCPLRVRDVHPAARKPRKSSRRRSHQP